MKTYLLGIATVIVLIIIGGAIFIWSGVYNIAADVPHWKITYLLLQEARDSSVSYHSRDIKATSPEGQVSLETGFHHYHEMCRLCHGAPGFERTEFAEGLYPSPPGLNTGKIQHQLSHAELLWVVRHGLKMTGMPSFDKTHTDEQIRDIVAFVEKLPDMTAEKYMARVRSEREKAPGMPGHAQGESH